MLENNFDIETHLKKYYPDLFKKMKLEHERKVKYENNLEALTGKWVRTLVPGHGGMGGDPRKVKGISKDGRCIELKRDVPISNYDRTNTRESISLVDLEDKERPWFTQFYVVEDEIRDKWDERLLKE